MSENQILMCEISQSNASDGYPWYKPAECELEYIDEVPNETEWFAPFPWGSLSIDSIDFRDGYPGF